MDGVISTMNGLRLAALPMLAALVLAAPASASEPTLRSVRQHDGHITAIFALGGLAYAAEIQVAVSSRVVSDGAFPRVNVRLRERMAPRKNAATRLWRWTTRHRLTPGSYYVQVSGVDVGATSCIPRGSDCLQQWSNVRKVVVPRH
ncbi:MAG: hypothetical protein WBB74_10740 [Gaiellaceae bacterium]